MTAPSRKDGRRPGEAFLFVACYPGAEAALKSELAREYPSLRFAFSRPGFVTFKAPAEMMLSDDFALHSAFARCYGISQGKASGATDQQRAEAVWQKPGLPKVDALHAWPREGLFDDRSDRQTKNLATIDAVREAVMATAPSAAISDKWSNHLESPTPIGDRVLDVILLDADVWWVGHHRVAGGNGHWPGGRRPSTATDEPASRAYWKMDEALRWSRLPVSAGDLCAELGCAPGGGVQALFERGLKVIGIDPAEIDPQVLADPNFTHLRKRAKEVPRRAYRGVRWLMTDMSVTPRYTLDCVGDIVSRPYVNIEGMLLTLKLAQWRLAEQLPEFAQEVRSWGFQDVRYRQLQHHGQEVCLAAMKGRRPH